MFLIIRLVAWTGGITAGAQVAGGVVRGVSELVRGNAGAAMLEVADGCISPLKNACQEVSKLGHDVYQAVVAPWQNELESLQEPVVTKRHRRRRQQEATDESVNGVSDLAAES